MGKLWHNNIFNLRSQDNFSLPNIDKRREFFTQNLACGLNQTWPYYKQSTNFTVGGPLKYLYKDNKIRVQIKGTKPQLQKML